MSSRSLAMALHNLHQGNSQLYLGDVLTVGDRASPASAGDDKTQGFHGGQLLH
jgi:hypothetical protein